MHTRLARALRAATFLAFLALSMPGAARAMEEMSTDELAVRTARWFKDCGALESCRKERGSCPCTPDPFNPGQCRCRPVLGQGIWHCDGTANIQVCRWSSEPFWGCKPAGGTLVNCGNERSEGCNMDGRLCGGRYCRALGRCPRSGLSVPTGRICWFRNCSFYIK